MKPANDNDAPLVTMTRAELAELVRDNMSEALAASRAMPVLVDKQDMARQLGCSPSSIDRLRREGLPSLQLAAQVVRFEPAKVIEWLREHKQHA